jgi:biotin carboxyl carrier protein
MHVIERDSQRVWEEAKWALVTAVIAVLVVALTAQSAGANDPPRGEPVFVVSPWTGVVRLSDYPGGPKYVEVGVHVEPGTVVAKVEDLMLQRRPMSVSVPAGVTGTIQRVLVDEGQVVVVGQALFEVIPDESILGAD